MGKVYSLLLRPIRRFNVENRAERVISKMKQDSAPQYPSVKRQKEVVDQLSPNFMETHYKKDPILHNHLKNVFVSSTDPEESPDGDTASSKSLVQYSPELDEPKSSISHICSRGKCTLPQALEFISMHQRSPEEYSVEKISIKYQLDKQTVQNILQHFSIFNSMDVNKPQLSAGSKRT